MKATALFVVGVLAILALAIPAEAQIDHVRRVSGMRGSYPGGRYGYYNDPRMMDPCFEAQQYFEGIRGTFHFHKSKNGTEKHFRACDPTNNRIGTVGGGGLGAGGGAVVGAVLGGRKGAGIGAVIGAGGGGVYASRHAHNNCVVVEPTQVQQNGGAPGSYAEPAAQQSIASPEAVSHDESHGPAYRPGKRPIVNSTAMYVGLYDGEREDENFVGEMAPGDSWNLAKPQNRYRAFAQVPNRRGSDTISEIDPEPTDTGWIFNEPQVAQGRK